MPDCISSPKLMSKESNVFGITGNFLPKGLTPLAKIMKKNWSAVEQLTELA